MGLLKIFGPAQNRLGPVKGQDINLKKVTIFQINILSSIHLKRKYSLSAFKLQNQDRLQARRKREGGGKERHFLADQYTLSQPGRGGHIIPTQYYVPPRPIFRPCDGPGLYIRPTVYTWKPWLTFKFEYVTR